MNPAIYIAIFLPVFVIIFQQNKNMKIIMKRIIKSNNKEEKFQMHELAKTFIDKECLIFTFNSQVKGIIKEVSDGAILLENKNIIEAVNLDFIIRIREYPKGKNGLNPYPQKDIAIKVTCNKLASSRENFVNLFLLCYIRRVDDSFIIKGECI